ncbi:MAG: histidine phosphatase family protein [Pseudomonadota bacterium]
MAGKSSIERIGLYATAAFFLGATLTMAVTGTTVLPDANAAVEEIDEAADKRWAKEIMNGGYILHFRHAERDKWTDVQMYDALESDVHANGENGSRFAEDDYFAGAVCLNARGKIQAKAMGETVEHVGLPVGPVYSSPSCRARQTADLTFGGVDEMNRLLVHRGPYTESESGRVAKLRDLYLSLPVEEGKNTVVSAHNQVVANGMFANDTGKTRLGEGGFYVISQNDGELVLEHEFHNFLQFSKAFYTR